MTDDLSVSLKAIGSLMTAASDPWWVIASGAVALHCADAGRVADVDVLLGMNDAVRIFEIAGIPVRRGSSHPHFRSGIFGAWRGTALPVEFMADFYHRSGPHWVQVLPATRQAINVGGTMVFVPEREELLALLLNFGRPKDIERARRLAALPPRSPQILGADPA